MDGDPSTPLGRHGTARVQPWHRRWLEVREALRIVVRLSQAEEGDDAAAARALVIELADTPAFRSIVTPDLDSQARGQWLAEIIRTATDVLYQWLQLPLPADAVPEQAILFWYLALQHGDTPPKIARHLHEYVADPETRSGAQWVEARMWATGKRPPGKAGPGLARLLEQIDRHLVASIPGEGAVEAAAALVHEALDRLFVEDAAAASWLAVFAHFAPDPIPLAPLQEEVPRGLPQVRGRLDLRPLSEYVERLISAGLVTRTGDGQFVVPAAIAAATLRYLSEDLRVRALRAAIVLLGMAFPVDADDRYRWATSEALVPHVLTVAAFAEQTPQGRADAATFFKRATAYYRVRAQLDDAIHAGRRAVAAGERAYGPHSPMLTGPLANLAHALAADGQFVEAEQLFLRVIELEEDTTSTSPVERAETLNLYGNLLVRMNRLADAEAAQRRALQVLPEHERGDSYWRILNDLASTVSRQERIREALPLFRAALAGLDGRSDGLIVRRNLGVTLLLLGELEEAREVLEAALAEQEAMEVWDLGLMAWTLRNLARVYTDLGDGPRAEDMYRRLAELDQPWVH